MILQVFAHTRQILLDGDAACAQMIRRSNARQQHQMRRADGSRAEDHLAPGMQCLRALAPAQ